MLKSLRMQYCISGKGLMQILAAYILDITIFLVILISFLVVKSEIYTRVTTFNLCLDTTNASTV